MSETGDAWRPNSQYLTQPMTQQGGALKHHRGVWVCVCVFSGFKIIRPSWAEDSISLLQLPLSVCVCKPTLIHNNNGSPNCPETDSKNNPSPDPEPSVLKIGFQKCNFTIVLPGYRSPVLLCDVAACVTLHLCVRMCDTAFPGLIPRHGSAGACSFFSRGLGSFQDAMKST